MTVQYILRLTLLIPLTFASNLLMAAPPKVAASDVLKKSIAIAEKEDVSAATAYLESQGAPLQVAENYSTLVKHLYMPGKDVPRMLLFGRAGIQFALTRAAKSKGATAEKLKGVAKTIAYNIGSNTWPGWKDEGIKITATDLTVGLDAARLNLRLGIELKRDDFILGNAHWLLGAQLLAAGKHKQALASFRKSTTKFRAAKKTDFTLMAKGYEALTLLAAEPAEKSRIEAVEASLAKLKQAGTDDAKFFAQQIRTAKAVFVKRRGAGTK